MFTAILSVSWFILIDRHSSDVLEMLLSLVTIALGIGKLLPVLFTIKSISAITEMGMLFYANLQMLYNKVIYVERYKENVINLKKERLNITRDVALLTFSSNMLHSV